jgi:hypothetical protein
VSRKKEKTVSNICGKRGLRLAIGTLAVLVFCGVAFSQEKGESKGEGTGVDSIASPVTPELITPPVGNSAFLVGHARGTQGYVCLPDGAGGASWTIANARPEATLFANIFGEAVQIITHFLSPVENPNKIGPNPPRFGDATWQSSFDSSRVWAQKEHFIAAGTDTSCPHAGSIDCLLLRVIGAAAGPTGGRSLTKTTYIQRLNTQGGSAPLTGCTAVGDVGKQALIGYSADYYFFRRDE